MKLRSAIWFYSTLVFLSLPATAQTTGSGSPAQVFTEYFSQSQPGSNWSLGAAGQNAAVPANALQSTALRWQQTGEAPGFHYYNYGQGYAVTPWNVGTQPFDLKFDVALTTGILHEWIRSGVFVALSTAAPGQMTGNSISAVIAIQGAGPAASVRQGVLYTKDAELSNISKWPVGGDVESIAWPNTDLPGTQLTMEMQRTAGNAMVFNFYRPDYKGGLQPWWTGSWQMPAALAATSFNYLMVQTLNPDTTNSVPAVGYAYQGVVSNIRAYVIGPENPPTVSAALPIDQSLYQAGATVSVSGQGFEPGASVWIANQSIPATFVSSTQLTFTLPALGPGTYTLKVINPSGLEGQVAGGITLYSGPTLLRVEPREASPAGGDVVTIVGAGFDSSTQVTINGQPAPVVQLVDSSHLQVQVPPGKPGIAQVQAQGSAAFSGSPSFGYAPHPYMYYTADALPNLQNKFNDPAYSSYTTLLTRHATDLDPNNPRGGVGDYLWVYLFTGNASYRASLWNRINAELDRIDFTDFRLPEAGIMATVYDTLFSELTPQQRTAFLNYLDRAYAVYNQMRTDNAWFLGPSGGNISNTTAVGNGGGGLVSLAIQNSTPGASTAIADAIKRITPFVTQCIAADGGDVEGPLYWNYGLTWYLQFAHVLQNATGSDHSLLTQPNLALNHQFVETTASGDGTFLTFNDSEPQLYGIAVMADLGTRFNQPLLLWMADEQARRAVSLNVAEDEATRYDVIPYAFLWRGSTSAPAVFPGLPTSSVLSNVQWGVMRSSPDRLAGLVVGLKGSSKVQTHHAQTDAGSFVLQAGGEGFFIDPGYYQPGAPQHSLPIVDGVSPGTTGATVSKVRDDGSIRSMVVDSTAAYGGKVQRVRRLVTLYGDRAVVIVDDIVPAAGQPGSVKSRFQAGFPAALGTGNSFSVQGQQSSVQATLYGPNMSLSNSGPNDFGRSWVFKSQGVQWYTVAAAYTASGDTPLVTVITTQPGMGTANTVSRIRRRSDSIGTAGAVTAAVNYASGQVTVSFSDGQAITFSQDASGSWNLN